MCTIYTLFIRVYFGCIWFLSVWKWENTKVCYFFFVLCLKITHTLFIYESAKVRPKTKMAQTTIRNRKKQHNKIRKIETEKKMKILHAFVRARQIYCFYSFFMKIYLLLHVLSWIGISMMCLWVWVVERRQKWCPFWNRGKLWARENFEFWTLCFFFTWILT